METSRKSQVPLFAVEPDETEEGRWLIQCQRCAGHILVPGELPWEETRPCFHCFKVSRLPARKDVEDKPLELTL